MAKKITVGLAVTADTSRAKAQLQDLQNQLNNIIKATSFDTQKLGITGDLNEAARAAAELKVHIEGAMNAHTGTLDFTKLNQSIKNSGTSLQAYSNKLLSIGPAGEKAFMSLANAVASSEIPLKRANKLIDGFWENLRKTAGWQVSSTAINTMVGSIQKAYGYAEDLNKSLNDIRVVTGQSADQMADFAAKANKAAKQLSATTLDYTEAALIYYQQGLEEEDVLKRTDTTIKMANVTGENAADVSSYMTAIWNNFDKGSKSLEYFGDVITALGAETAASSEEIAGGLEKFAAIGETVGLSYEYATAAVTTIIDKTRQSEDVVGNALKTIFARIQGLQLGETQEDGVTLNKYSEALQKVGISILDSTGQMKEMDIILDELGGKWDILSKAQQTALAQTVGGTRQYAQLIALMDNWSSFQDNLDVAYGSTGTLQEQADIYAESWEAARDRVQTAAEGLYDSLIDDDFFIGALNVIEDLITGVERLVDGMGGLGGVVSTLGAVFTKVFNKQIADNLSSMAYNIKMSTESGRASIRKEKDLELEKMMENMKQTGRSSEQVESFSKQLSLQKSLTENAHLMNNVELQNNQLLLDRYKLLSNNLLELKEQTKELKKQGEEAEKLATDKIYDHLNKGKHSMSVEDWKNNKSIFNTQLDNLHTILNLESELKGFDGDLTYDWVEKTEESVKQINDKIGKITVKNKKASIEKNSLGNKLNNSPHIFATDDTLTDNAEQEVRQQLELLKKQVSTNLKTLGLDKKTIDDIIIKYEKYLQLKAKGEELTREERDEYQRLQDELNNIVGVQKRLSDVIVTTANALTSFTAVVNSIQGIVNVLEDDSLSGWEKFVSILGSIGMLIPNIMMLTNAIVALNSAESQRVIITNISTLAEKLDTWAKKQNTTATIADTVATKANTEAEKENGMVTLTLGQAMTKLKGSILANLPALGMLALKIAAVVAVGWIIVKVFEQIKNSTPEGKLKALNEEAEKAKTTAEGIANAYQSVSNVLDDIDSKRTALQNLNKDSLEWYATVSELNQKVIDLLTHYGLLSELEWEDGIAKISEDGQQIIEDKLKESLMMSASYASLASINTVQQQNANDIQEKINNYDLSNIAQSQIIKVGTNAANANKVEEIFTEGEGRNLIKKLIAQEDFATLSREDIKKQVQEELSTHEYANSIDFDKLTDFIFTEGRNFITDIQTQEIQNNNALSQQYKMLGDKLFGTELKDYELNDIEQQAILTAGGKAIDALQEKIYNEEYAFGWGEYKNKNAAYQAYAEQSGLTKNEEGEYVDFNGNVVELTDTLVKGSLALSQASIEVKSNLDSIVSSYEGATLKSTGQFSEYTQSDSMLDAKQTELEISDELLDTSAELLKTRVKDNKALTKNENALKSLALAQAEVNKGIESLSEGWEDNYVILKDGNTATLEYAEALTSVKSSLEDMYGVEVSNDFVQENLEAINQIANGNIDGFDELGIKVAKDYVQGIISEIDNEEQRTKIQSAFEGIITEVESNLGTLEIGTALDSAYIDDLNEMLKNGDITVAQVQGLFNSLGFDPDVEMEQHTSTVTGNFGIGSGENSILSIPWYNKTTVEVPVIKGANYKGGEKTISASNKGLTGSKSSSSKDSKSMKNESERYHVIKEVIEDLENELDKLGEAKDRAFGSKKLKAIDDETAALENLLAAEKQYKKEVEDYYKKDKAAIAAYGAKFDENGIITNYEDLIQQQVNKYNASKTDEAEKAYEKFKEALEQYEETHDLLQEKEKDIRDLENKIRDNILEGIQAKVDIQIEVNDDDIAFLDHLLGNLEDSAYDAAEAIAYLGQQTAANLKSNEAYIQGINDIFASQGVADAADRFISGELTTADLKEMEFTEDEVAALKEYRDGLMETTEQLQELRDTIWEEVMESLEELSEEFDEQSDVVDHLSGVLDHYRNIVDIVGQEALGISDDMMKMFSDVAVDSAIDNLAISVDKLEGLREARAEQERALAQATTEEEIKRWTETIEETDKLIRDAEENMLSSWEEALEAAAKAFEETVTRAISNFEKAMSGTFGNLDALQDAFDKQKELDDLYLDDYKQIYELSKLTRDINKSIDDIDNLAGKEALRDILTEINQLQEDGVELSEYDLNFLRAKYELRLAEIALEEAQNAKSQVRMTRDSEGNWSYTYTADQENIDTATQNYEDKLYAIQELSSNYIEEMESQILGLNQAMLDEIAGLDQNATDYMEQVNRITAFYQEKMTAYNDQINNALSNNKEIYDNDWTNYSNATGYKISANEDFIDNFAETTLSMLTGFQDMESYQQAFNDAIGHPDIEDSLLGQLTAGYNEWKNRVEIAMNEAGTSTDQFGKHMEDMAIKVDETTDFAALAAEALKKDMDTVFDGIVSKVKTFEDSYGDAIDNLVQKNAALAGKLNEVFAAWSHVTSESGKALQVAKDYSQYAGKTNLEELVDLINQAGGMSSVNNTSSGSSKYVIDPSTQTGVRPTRMATGGYTGEWGPSGKWALLDEKELVLNASDTKNMLSIIGAVRDISRTIDLNTNGFGLGALVASGISSSESTLNQNVEIHAEFPNATNRGEIEAAFDNLINRASQYTNRKN